jgi:hypothetical protein
LLRLRGNDAKYHRGAERREFHLAHDNSSLAFAGREASRPA